MFKSNLKSPKNGCLSVQENSKNANICHIIVGNGTKMLINSKNPAEANCISFKYDIIWESLKQK